MIEKIIMNSEYVLIFCPFFLRTLSSSLSYMYHRKKKHCRDPSLRGGSAAPRGDPRQRLERGGRLRVLRRLPFESE